MAAQVIESERLVYLPISLHHLSEEYVGWLNDPEVCKYLETGGNHTLAMLEQFLAEAEKKNILFWGIHLKETGSHIGNIKIDPVNRKHGTCEYGILMGNRQEWGKGYAKEASLRIIDYCFTDEGLRKMTLGVVEQNRVALNLYKKIGFVTEGIYHRHGIYDGIYCDVVRMALFNPAFSYE